jgi:hypothetical protein
MANLNSNENLCDIATIYNKYGCIDPYIKKNYNKLKNNPIYCIFNNKSKFMEGFFPNFIGDSIDEIINKICMFIEKSSNFNIIFIKTYENFLQNLLDENVVIINKMYLNDFYIFQYIVNNLPYFYTYKNINKNNSQELLKTIFYYLINNISINKIKNYVLNTEIIRIENKKKNKYKNINNFKELYKQINLNEFNINEKYKFIGKEIKYMKKIYHDIKKNIDENEIRKYYNFNMKNLPKNINFYLKYIPPYYNKDYIKKNVETILKNKNII